jgi:hypothetical protein
MKFKKSWNGNVEKTFLYRLTLFSTRYIENCGTRSIFRYTYFFRSKIFFSFFLKSLIGWKFDHFQVRLISIHKKNLSSIGPQEAEIDFWVGGPLNSLFTCSVCLGSSLYKKNRNNWPIRYNRGMNCSKWRSIEFWIALLKYRIDECTI